MNNMQLEEELKKIVFTAGKMMVKAREDIAFTNTFKDDGSPVTNIDEQVQAYIENELIKISPHKIIGEENQTHTDNDTYWAIDPIDGTWGYISYENTSVVNLSLIEQGKVTIGIVYNPFTQEYFFSFGKGASVNKHQLPIVKNDAVTIVNFCPSTQVHCEKPLFDLLREDTIKKLTAIGGSVSYAMCMVAKGSFSNYLVYFNKMSQPWDFSASHLIVKQAGGMVTDLSGNEIDPNCYEGYFLVSDTKENHNKLLGKLKDIL